MKFNPKAASTLIPDGEYDAEIAAAEEAESKKGNAMMKLTVRVWAGGGGPRTVFDYIVDPHSIWKLKQIAAAIGKQDVFESGDMGPGEIAGESVRVAIKTQKDRTGQFEDKNVVARYLAPAAGMAANDTGASGAAGGDHDDNIPF